MKSRVLSKSMRLLCLILALVASPTCSLCEDPLLCSLGKSVVEDMYFQIRADGKIDPAVLMGSVAFLERCPADVIPAFKPFANDKEGLPHRWIVALITDRETNGDLNTFLTAAHWSVAAERSSSLDKFLDGLFDPSATTPKAPQSTLDHLFEQQVSSTLVQFRHCDAAECYDVSDFLLFLLGTDPTAFMTAMHSDLGDAAKWLSQHPDLSFTGEPSDAQNRARIRRLLLKKISIAAAPGLQDVKSQCIGALSGISFRPWN